MSKVEISNFVIKRSIVKHLKDICEWHKNIHILRKFTYNMYLNNLYIDSNSAKVILRDTGIDSCRKAKYILPLVIDNWNITKQNGFKEVEERIFKRLKPVKNEKILSSVRKRYTKQMVNTLIINDSEIFGSYAYDSDTTHQYECY